MVPESLMLYVSYLHSAALPFLRAGGGRGCFSLIN